MTTTTTLTPPTVVGGSNNILLDSNIRDWVVLPLFIIMVAAGLLRFHMGNILKPKPKSSTKISQRTQASVRATLGTLNSGSIHFLSTSKLESRKIAYPELLRDQAEWCETYLDNKEAAKEEADGADDDADMPNPFAQMDGMMGNMAFMIQNMVMMQAIQHCFAGFILLKVPFGLTIGFKQMFQRGLEGLATLDTSYVSSVSWYFLVMFGLRGFFRLVIGTPSLETQQTQQLWHKFGLMPGGGGPAAGPDDDKQIKQLTTEADNMELLLPKNFKSNLDQVEKRLLKKKYPKKKAVGGGSSGKGGDFLLQQQSAKKNK